MQTKLDDIVKDEYYKSLYKKDLIKYSYSTTPLAQPNKYKGDWPKITLFGDSMTRFAYDLDMGGCWATMLMNKVSSYFSVDARGFPAYNTRQGVMLLEKLFPTEYLEGVELLIVFFGHNDTWQDESWTSDVKVSTSLDEFKFNIKTMITYFTKNGVDSKRIIFITPAWYGDTSGLAETYGLRCEKTYEHAVKYKDAMLDICKEHKVTTHDFFKDSYAAVPWTDYFHDGIHINRLGADLLFKGLWPVVADKIVEIFGKPIENLHHSTKFEHFPEVIAIFASLEAKKKAKDASTGDIEKLNV